MPTTAHSGCESQLGATRTATTAIRWADDPGPMPLQPLQHRSLEGIAWTLGGLVALAMIIGLLITSL